MTRTALQLRKWVMLIHRWMGVGFCVLFLVWFISGIVMMYWGYPKISLAQRLSKAEEVDPSRVQISPEDALSSLKRSDLPTQARLAVLDGRPAYRFTFPDRLRVIFADTGEQVDAISPEMGLRIAAAWAERPAQEATFRGALDEVDQWTVNPSVSPYRPYLKYSWPNGEEVYISQFGGEVAQHTTRWSRLTTYLGAVPHWLYFTPLRKDVVLWDRVVTWSSGIGTVMTLLGLVAGLWLYSPSKRYRFPAGRSSVPYAGQKRWHVILGLVFGLVTCTWAFSGMMSMSPFSALKSDGGGRRVQQALRGGPVPIPEFSAKPPAEALRQAAASELRVKGLELARFDGEPVYFAWESPEQLRVVPVRGGPQRELPQERLLAAVERANPGKQIREIRLVTEHEAYYVDRKHELPLPALFIQLDDPEGSMYYVDPRTANVVQSYAAGSRWNRWLYHGLHSFDLPWLYKYRPAWDIVVLALMLGGTALCFTSVVIGWRRLRRKLAAHPHRRTRPERAYRQPSLVIERKAHFKQG